MSSSFPLPLSEKEEAYFVAQLEEGTASEKAEARNTLIERNLRLVAHVAKKYVSPSTCQDDLISIGTIGLIKAVNTYRSTRATRLATYAAKCIENEILMSIRASKKTRQDISLSLPLGIDKDGNEISFNDILGTDPDAVLDTISLKIQVGKLHAALDEVLTPREKVVIVRRYGLDGYEPKTQREISTSLGISRSYVSRIEKKALGKLRERLRNI